MPVFERPKSLADQSIASLTRIVHHILREVIRMTETTDDAMQIVENQMEDAIAAGSSDNYQYTRSSPKYDEAKKAALDLINVKHMVEKHGNIGNTLMKYIEKLPSEFMNEILSRIMSDLITMLGDYDEDHVEYFMNEKWSFPARLRVAFRMLLKLFVSKRTFTLNLSPLTKKYFDIFQGYLMKTQLYKDNEYMAEMKDKNDYLFVRTLLSFSTDFTSLTSISMQNLACGHLLWSICCNCPNLWYLDLSGPMFDLQRYCVHKEAAGEYVTAFNKNDERQYEDADFIDALCGLYGESNKNFDEIPEGCKKLRRLLLPDYSWEANEERALVEVGVEILVNLIHLEELTGVCLFRILCKLCEKERYCPRMLKLRKFDGKGGGAQLVGIDPKRLQTVKLPLVEEVVFVVNRVMQPSALQSLFPNMKHLTVMPYNSQAYSFPSILPSLTNLVSLDIEYAEGLSLANMCDLSLQCCSLKSLSITCPGLYTKKPDTDTGRPNDNAVIIGRSPPFYERVDKEEKYVYEDEEDEDNRFHVFYYPRKISDASYMHKFPKDDDSLPKFSKLETLQFFDLQHVDHFALYQCVRGSPLVQVFTVVIGRTEKGEPYFDDFYFMRIASHLKQVREVTLASVNNEDNYLKISYAAVAHFLYFCPYIRSISRLDDWNMSLDQIQGLNYYFKTNNYNLRVH